MYMLLHKLLQALFIFLRQLNTSYLVLVLIEFGLPSQFRLCGDGAGNVLFERHSAVDAKRFDDLRGFCNGNQFDHEHLQISIREEFWVVRALDCLHLHVALDCIYQKWIARFGLERFFSRGQNLPRQPPGIARWANFAGLVLGCIEAKLCKKICV